jgi:hypothetical protein
MGFSVEFKYMAHLVRSVKTATWADEPPVSDLLTCAPLIAAAFFSLEIM